MDRTSSVGGADYFVRGPTRDDLGDAQGACAAEYRRARAEGALLRADLDSPPAARLRRRPGATQIAQTQLTEVVARRATIAGRITRGVQVGEGLVGPPFA
jgi:hypothetical protein